VSALTGIVGGEAIDVEDVASVSLRFENGLGGAVIVEVDDFPHFAIWAKAGAPYLCIEAWTGYSDPEDFDGELADKPSMRLLPAGARARHAVRLSYEPG
jgi:galactose mutarotase-like enzyme